MVWENCKSVISSTILRTSKTIQASMLSYDALGQNMGWKLCYVCLFVAKIEGVREHVSYFYFVNSLRFKIKKQVLNIQCSGCAIQQDGQTGRPIIWGLIKLYKLTCDVPQGSVLRPVLFILFTADVIRIHPYCWNVNVNVNVNVRHTY